MCFFQPYYLHKFYKLQLQFITIFNKLLLIGAALAKNYFLYRNNNDHFSLIIRYSFRKTMLNELHYNILTQ